MVRSLHVKHTIVALLLSASCSIACGGSAIEDGAGSDAGGSSGETANGGTASGASSGGTASAGASSGGTANGGVGGSCEQRKNGYIALLGNLLSESANTSCAADSDCTYISTSSCGNACSSSLVSTTAGPAIISELDDYATATCATCRFPVTPCPLDLLPAPMCFGGRCQAYYPL